jgi:hypothetical protein
LPAGCPQTSKSVTGRQISRDFFFLWADTPRERGVTLYFASPAEINKINGDTWRPIFPILDPAFEGTTAQTGFAQQTRVKL